MTTEALKVADAMEKYGGGFVKALSVCIRKADANNLLILMVAFSEYWKQYLAMAEGGEG